MDIRLDGRRVQTQAVARDLLLAYRVARERGVDLLPGRRAQRVLELVERSLGWILATSEK